MSVGTDMEARGASAGMGPTLIMLLACSGLAVGCSLEWAGPIPRPDTATDAPSDMTEGMDSVTDVADDDAGVEDTAGELVDGEDPGDVVDEDMPPDLPSDIPADDAGMTFGPIPRVSDDLLTYITSMTIPTSTDVVRDLSSGRRSRWENLIDSILTGDWAGASSEASMLGADLVVVDDTVSGRPYIVLSQLGRGEGIYAFDPAYTNALVVEVPYPVASAASLVAGIEILRGTPGWALLVAGGGRCTSTWWTGCDGTTVSCASSPEPYLTSDVAHYTEIAFPLVHDTVMAFDTSAIALQLQDQPDASGADAILSDGTDVPDTTTPSISITLRNAIRTHLPAHASSTVSCNDPGDSGYTSACNTTNIEGRSTNGSSAPCTAAATSSSGRFVALEMAGVMYGSSSVPGLVSAARELFP